MPDPVQDPEVVLAQFNRLMNELLRGTMTRNCFRPWEVDLLLDIESCDLRETVRRDTLRRYQKAVQRHFERGGQSLIKLSEYMETERRRRETRSEAGAAIPLRPKPAGSAVS